MHWEPQKSWRHKEYIKALRALGVNVIESKFQKIPKFCHRQAAYCKFYEEKQTDVAFAVALLNDAHDGKIDKAIVVTADSDHIPVVESINQRFPDITTLLAAPPGRLSIARELGQSVSQIAEIKRGRIAANLLPRNVEDQGGKIVARCPKKYIED